MNVDDAASGIHPCQVDDIIEVQDIEVAIIEECGKGCDHHHHRDEPFNGDSDSEDHGIDEDKSDDESDSGDAKDHGEEEDEEEDLHEGEEGDLQESEFVLSVGEMEDDTICSELDGCKKGFSTICLKNEGETSCAFRSGDLLYSASGPKKRNGRPTQKSVFVQGLLYGNGSLAVLLATHTDVTEFLSKGEKSRWETDIVSADACARMIRYSEDIPFSMTDMKKVVASIGAYVHLLQVRNREMTEDDFLELSPPKHKANTTKRKRKRAGTRFSKPKKKKTVSIAKPTCVTEVFLFLCLLNHLFNDGLRVVMLFIQESDCVGVVTRRQVRGGEDTPISVSSPEKTPVSKTPAGKTPASKSQASSKTPAGGKTPQGNPPPKPPVKPRQPRHKAQGNKEPPPSNTSTPLVVAITASASSSAIPTAVTTSNPSHASSLPNQIDYLSGETKRAVMMEFFDSQDLYSKRHHENKLKTLMYDKEEDLISNQNRDSNQSFVLTAADKNATHGRKQQVIFETFYCRYSIRFFNRLFARNTFPCKAFGLSSKCTAKCHFI